MDNDHIDVCMGCGRYYGHTQMAEDYWRVTFKPGKGQIMPQLCFKCLSIDAELPMSQKLR
jgi:hypothetical protein